MIAAGQSIGNYRVLSKIGTGGMGAVYLAEHPLIGKKVALKVIHRELATNREVVQRFYQEAKAVNTIGSDHIVEIHDFGVTPEGDHFYIMEYLEGRTLASVLSREKVFATMRALHIGAQIAQALAAAHASGVIHRDLKPDNVMLMQRLGDPDFVKVLDFGLAKMFAAGGASAVQTAVGVLLGTPQYMSPEACESKRDIDHRTDIYALGVLLFQMMTGVLPFTGDSMGEVLVKQVTALPPAPRGLNPQIPPSVEQILLRCLAKHPDARFPTMQALRDALLDPEAYLRGSPPIAPARSVAPGEAKVSVADVIAAADARTRVVSAEGRALPLQPPQRTMIDGAHSAPGVAARPHVAAVPDLAQPVEPTNNTMRIATPLGHTSRPPRKVWPIVLVVGLLLGVGGGAFAVAWFGREERADASTGAATTTTSADGEPVVTPIVDAGAVASAVVVDAAVAATPFDAAAVDAAARPTVVDAASAHAKLTLDSRPPGALVLAPDGRELGTTPLKLEWPTSPAPVTFTFKLRGHRDKTLELTVTSATVSSVDLDKLPSTTRPNPGRGSGSGSGTRRPGGDGDALERPE